MIDSLRQQFSPRMRQAGRDRKISDSYKMGYSCSMCEEMFVSVFAFSPSNNITNIGKTAIPVSARFKELAQHPPHKKFGT